MEKSNATTERPATFFGKRHAHLQEWIWACLLVALTLGGRAWKDAESERHWKDVPRAHVHDLLCWAEQLPGPPLRGRKRRWEKRSRDNGRFNSQAGTLRSPNAGVAEEVQAMEINGAIAEDWQKFRGIGPVLSKRILGFKNLLGGFIEVDQLYLVYGLDSSLVEDIKPMLNVEPSLVKPMCLEEVTYGDLARHPRFGAKAAKAILRARGRGVSSIDLLWERLTLDSAMRRHWMPYLHCCCPPQEGDDDLRELPDL